MKQADELQPWTLSIRARAKRFHFNLKYSKTFPICKLFRLSIRFKLRPFTFKFESKPGSAFSLKRECLRIFKGFRRKRSGKKWIVKTWLSRRENYWFGRRKFRAWFWVLLFAAVGCFVIMQLRSYFRSRFLWNFFWMIWNYAIPAPSALFHQFF
ncbi:uncharacterized protein LOC131019835 [Salvia miltiorrhiza]|uniref:uncharacterized protein LOC131019835 n=1 Tax=Salvia miltiorrhiza TaxID=226208 RepID=UPI0025ACAAC8|nr:uncharacterized protein LOC131019835 [Salvia miltiorrhiza]